MAKQKILTESKNESSYAAITKATKECAQRILAQESKPLSKKRRNESEKGNKEASIKERKERTPRRK